MHFERTAVGACAIGFGKAVPSLVVNNEELTKLVDTSDEWIVSRTGISSRHISVNETLIDLAAAAACQAMGLSYEAPDGLSIESTGVCESAIDPASIDLLILTTITPDVLVPSNAAALKKLLGLENAVAFDINAACTGFVYGISIANAMMIAANGPAGATMNGCKRALIVSSERLSRLTDWQDRNTCVLFGDGAGAMVLEWQDGEAGVLSTYMRNDDDDTNALICKHSFNSPIPFDENGVIYDADAKVANDAKRADEKDVVYDYINGLGLSADPASWRIDELFDFDDRPLSGGPEQYIYMNGQKVFKFAAKAMENAVRQALDRAGITLDDVAAIVPHQANYRILEFAAKRLDLPIDRFQVSIGETGNSSSSCLPMALVDAITSGKASHGDIVILVAFGGGLTSGAVALRL